jgi:ferritin-like metal-binding protein YciE
MAATTLHDLYSHKLRAMLDCEQQIVQALPQLVHHAKSQDLREALDKHLGETRGHVERLQRIMKSQAGSAPRAECQSMRAMIQETQSMLPNIQDPDTIDAFIIASAQAVEHHEMADYGTARAWAEQLGLDDDADTLQDTLDEEIKADKTLTDIAVAGVNQQATRGREREVGIGAGGTADRPSREEGTTGRPVPGATNKEADRR